MHNEKTSVFANGLIWFGAGVSIAEILTGMLLAPLGFQKGLAAILLGHLIGGVLMYLAGIIGANTEKSAMETVKLSFGGKGALFFSSLNVLQLVGWTAVMIVSGASAASSVLHFGGSRLWAVIIGALIVVWILIGIRQLRTVNVIAMSALGILTVILSVILFRGDSAAVAEGSISFGSAVELSVAMPLSWLPLIADYTRFAKRKQAATVASVAVYALVSSWMFVIGMGAVLFAGESDFSVVLRKAGLGAAGLLIVVFSTVTTTFLDAFSAGVSTVSITKKVTEKQAAIAVAVIGTILALFTPTDRFESFLYLIGSVFAPMIAIEIVDYFILKKDRSDAAFDRNNLIVWVLGFLLYRGMMRIETPVGNTLPVMLLTALLCVAVNKLFGGKQHAQRNA